MFGFSLSTWALVALFGPLLAAGAIALMPAKKSGHPSAYLSVAAALLSLLAAVILLAARWSDAGAEPIDLVVRWLPSGGSSLADVGLRLDGIAMPMLVVVTGVASCVQVFSLGYMADEPPAAFARYFGYHSLFIFSMNLLVLAPNLLQLFAGWELVGLTSYLLIGFYYQKPSAARAAVKAFWMTKFADMGLLIALVLLFSWTCSFGWDAILSEEHAFVVTLLLFVAVMGKSAQFPLHVWLPDAMEGPTPVSALLHAATMVAAGVFLIVRSYPLFAQAPDTLDIMMWVGSFTALFAAVVATVQTDIKKVLAYSTCSQLGYMVCALGAGSVMGGYFHLTTHACFKALLFLAAGSVIHGVHSNELADMGGLFGRMKVTAIVFIVGALALAGVPGLAGFFSKDLILEATAARGAYGPLVLLMAAAFLTALYMGRVIKMAFFGAPSAKAKKAHESGTTMLVPLGVLAVGSVLAGFFGGSFADLYQLEYHFHVGTVGIVATLLGLAGLGSAFYIYGRPSAEKSFAFLAPVVSLARSGLVDRTYQLAFRHVLLSVANVIGWFDRYVVDGLINMLGWATIMGGRAMRRTQTGNVQDYVLAVVASAAVLLAWGVLR